ncbi:3-methyl-2-oxobutanoate hydroxymethyltransferase PanB [Penicillium chermesinum]|uniref:3-methyl-2-oxobutanoate hydroxymethyltransferase n=1 Tax=Penicillium chermesinum TaxID=63820 RepID=A0A9W9TKD3_9EURO|nr:3-methyl-2-oxobutanoate hydroxymethyltransferase PanB [Penicillium chermesinum]KAJ5226067.1 3-methyl-2-oxobutanoate hydroxymethyltransferase PanB [Penicillium chermesinum]
MPAGTLRPSRSISIARRPLTTNISTVARRSPCNSYLKIDALPHVSAPSLLLPYSQVRHSSHSPPDATHNGRKKVTLQTIRNLYRKGEPITMLTAHDFPSAHAAEIAGIEIVLVGDSLGMVAMGLEDTTEMVLDEMILHCRSVSRGAKSAFIVGDLPMGSFEISPEQAVGSALRLMKEGRVHGVKIEGGEELGPTIKRITQVGIPVVGHGKTVKSATKILRDALVMQEAGVSMFVLEALPPEVATLITKKLSVPTIGIGAGNGCSGQVLVQIDMTGNFQPGRFVPKFAKQYADVWGEATRGITQYREEVKSRAFPSPEYTYPVSQEELAKIEKAFSEFQE